jgi:transposase
VIILNEYYILLRLDRREYKIMKIEEQEGIIWVDIKSKKNKVRCPECNKFTSSIHSKLKPIKSTYLDSCGQEVKLIIHKRRFHCYNCNKIFTELLNLTENNGSISNATKIQIRKDLFDYNLTLDKIATKNHVSKYIVRKELEEATSTIPDHIKNLPRVISFDEFKADTSEGKYAFILNDPIHKKVLDILPNRKKEYLIQYFSYCNNRHSVEFVISDMYEPYLLVQKIMFKKAKYVVDKFHYTRYIMDALDKIRINLQKQYGEKSKEYKLLKNKKNVSLLRKYGNEIDWWVETERYKNGHMVKVLPGTVLRELKEISPELEEGYQLKEMFLDIINHSTYEEAETELINWIKLCKESKISEFIEASNTIENWLPHIVNSFIDKRYTNGFTEGTNNKIKVIKRNAFGYKNFQIFRKRILYIFNHKLGGGTKNGRSCK